MSITQKVVDDLVKTIFEPDTKRLTAWLDQIVNKHRELVSLSDVGFLVKGTFYKHSQAMPPRGKMLIRNHLAVELTGEFMQYYQDRCAIDRDMTKARQLLTMLICSANDAQEIRDGIPDSLVVYTPFKDIPRKMLHYNCWIKNDKRLCREVADFLPKIEMYAGMRLIL